MLSAFTARPIVELKQRDKSKIESILAFGNRLLVGLSTGSLRIYRVNEDAIDLGQLDGQAPSAPVDESVPSRPRVVELLRELEKFSSKVIQQLAIIKEANILVSLSDGTVSIHDLQHFELQEQLSKTKGAGTFAVTSDIIKDASTGIPSIVSRLAVAVKRKLLVWSWHDTELSEDVTELTLTAPAKTLTWASGTKIVCGMNSGYVVVDVTTSDVSEIFGPGSIGTAGQEGGRFGGVGAAGMGYMGMGSWVPKPLATRLTDGELLLAKDINTLFIDAKGTPSSKRQLPWSTAPEAISFSYPYVLALHSSAKGTLEVRNPDTRSLLQSIALPNATQLHVPQPNVSLAHAGKGFLVASDRTIWRMEAEPYGSQIDQLVEGGRLDEAISLLDMLEDALVENKEERMREIKIKKAEVLFDARKYRDSLDLFTDISAPPETVIRLYPPSIAGDLSVVEAKEGTMSPVGSARDPERSKSPTGGRPKTASRRQDSETGSIGSLGSAKKADLASGSDTGSVKGKAESTSEGRLEGEDLQNAVSGLCNFLADTRRKLQRFLNPDGTLKPTTSTDSGTSTTKPEFESLLVAPSSAADDDRERKLQETARLVDTTLFKAYMLARPGLAGSLFRIANFCDPDVVNEKLLETRRYSELVDFFHGKKLHRPALELLKKYGQADIEETPPALRGVRRTVLYLQSLPPDLIDLVLEFAEWVIRQDAEAGMEVFLADTENAETLPRDKVLAWLANIDESLAAKYLEHVINELNDLTPAFHQRLLQIYLTRLEASDADRPRLLKKLLDFLRSSSQYSTAKALNLIPRDVPDFYEARAIVLSRMGQHKQALEIYVFQLQDHDKAEEYCNRVHLSTPTASTEGEKETSIYHTLLSLYLSPPPPHSPSFPPALALLSRHGPRLPAPSTLSLLPPSLPIADLQSYFTARIRTANSLVNQGRIVAGLHKTERVGAQAALLGSRARGRKVLVSEERVCGVCHRRLGGSAVSVLPDDSVVHYGCARRVHNTSQGLGGGMDALRKSPLM
ncbi:MAG: Vacuolar morphogenesis protein 6 [Thelocarpon impressellum]|nr:MAG: Vacuolar morphogenesis protein 6 [Thelocarpon impressellum]